MSKRISVPRGTKDINPSEIPQWECIEFVSRNLLKTYGYTEIRTPLFEEIGLFKRSLGQSSEVVNKQLLELKSSKEEGFALRPEGTAAVVRAYNEQGLERKENLSKLFYIGPMFRGERPQKGRLRQFHQIGAEAIGRGGYNPLLDAEMIALAVRLIEALGVKKYKVSLNSLGSQEDKDQFAKWLRNALKNKIGQLNEESQDQFKRNVFRLLDSKDKECQKLVKSLNIGEFHLSSEGQAYFAIVKKALDDLGIDYEVSSSLVRGLDYYTHTVFEITADGLGSQDAIGAGGRYNGLVEQLGGSKEVGAIGFALGIERILLCLNDQEQEGGLDVFGVYFDQEFEVKMFNLINELRDHGIYADMDFGQRNFKKQLDQANKLNARYAMLLGEDEFNQKAVTLKEMVSGDQETIKWSQLAKKLQKKVLD